MMNRERDNTIYQTSPPLCTNKSLFITKNVNFTESNFNRKATRSADEPYPNSFIIINRAS